ncbi:hypothetical protein [Halobacteriovorax sp. RT-2-4]|uniref:hypothetical protein n=1 Tax=unclassified Halobacteriovorax TaxID=2639665 RepID=UPI00399AFEBE
MPVAYNNEVEIKINRLKNWFSDQNFTNVELIENISPANDKYPDYVVVYEAVFKPKDLETLQVEVWIEETGNIGIGVETWPRVLERFGKSVESVRFAGGHEPVPMDIDQLLAILKIISDGCVAIQRGGTSLFNLYNFKVLISSDDMDGLSTAGYPYLDFLSSIDKIPENHSILKFNKW